MAIRVPYTPDNAALANAVAARMSAETTMVDARSAFWRYVGAGTVLTALGVAVGIGCVAYAHVQEVQVTNDMLAEAMTKAFENVTLATTTTGEVRATGEVALAAGQKVGLDPNATVKLDPAATVRVEGEIAAAPAPAPASTAPGAGGKIITDYTVFKRVAYRNGAVITGWKYASNTEIQPGFQYCYYTETLGEGTRATLNFAEDGKMLENIAAAPGFDVGDAFRNCVWYR